MISKISQPFEGAGGCSHEHHIFGFAVRNHESMWHQTVDSGLDYYLTICSQSCASCHIYKDNTPPTTSQNAPHDNGQFLWQRKDTIAFSLSPEEVSAWPEVKMVDKSLDSFTPSKKTSSPTPSKVTYSSSTSSTHPKCHCSHFKPISKTLPNQCSMHWECHHLHSSPSSIMGLQSCWLANLTQGYHIQHLDTFQPLIFGL